MMRKFGLIGSLLDLGIGQALAQAVAPGVADFDFCGTRRVGSAAFGQMLVSAGESSQKILDPGYFLRSCLGLKSNKDELKQLLIN